MNKEETEFYKNKRQEYQYDEAKFTKEELGKKRENGFSLISEDIQENCEKYPLIASDVVEKWTVTHRMWSAMYLKNITDSINSFEDAISALKQLTPTGINAWSRESAITFIWKDLDFGKAHLKSALNYIKLSSQKKEIPE